MLSDNFQRTLASTISLKAFLEFNPTLVECAESTNYRAAFIEQPRDNQNESFKFNSRHSEFVPLRGQALNCRGQSILV